jgi:hypothetical protein
MDWRLVEGGGLQIRRLKGLEVGQGRWTGGRAELRWTGGRTILVDWRSGRAAVDWRSGKGLVDWGSGEAGRLELRRGW